uniref:Uncharacterized protein n=1 Tax=Glossina austeni TaxID=7395 RepID=A0A1A9VPS4_GLOAU
MCKDNIRENIQKPNNQTIGYSIIYFNSSSNNFTSMPLSSSIAATHTNNIMRASLTGTAGTELLQQHSINSIIEQRQDFLNRHASAGISGGGNNSGCNAADIINKINTNAIVSDTVTSALNDFNNRQHLDVNRVYRYRSHYTEMITQTALLENSREITRNLTTPEHFFYQRIYYTIFQSSILRQTLIMKCNVMFGVYKSEIK